VNRAARPVRELRAERFQQEPDMVVLGFVDGEGRIDLFLLSDAQGYDVMREMKAALFDVEPVSRVPAA
jgi:hypothetical protein